MKKKRDSAYKAAKHSGEKTDWLEYKNFRQQYRYQYRLNMINYFADKTMSNFKNSKLFWDFYKSSLRMKSDKSQDHNNLTIKINEKYHFRRPRINPDGPFIKDFTFFKNPLNSLFL